jgi:hypothetical protein
MEVVLTGVTDPLRAGEESAGKERSGEEKGAGVWLATGLRRGRIRGL